MAMKTASRFAGKARDAYLDLVLQFPLVSIRSEEQLGGAQRVMDRLLAKRKLNCGEEMYLDALSDLVATYEDRYHPIEPASDADMLRHLMEAKDKSQADIHREAGIAKSTISEVLAVKRPFSRRMIRKLAVCFAVDVTVLSANL